MSEAVANGAGAATSDAAAPPAPTPVSHEMVQSCVVAWAKSGPAGAQKASKMLRMLERVDAEPFDSEAWVVLAQEAQQHAPQPELYRPVFARFLHFFPSAVQVWRQFIELELRGGQLLAAESLFGDCLIRCPEVELWRLYLRYVQHHKQAQRAEVVQAYELLLESVGDDVDAGALWSEFIASLCAHAEDQSAQSEAVRKVRHVYHLAVAKPVDKVESIWKEYEAWENSVNPGAAKQATEEVRDKHKVAARASKERRALRNAVQLNALARPLRGTPAECAQLAAWRKLWQYEASNAQRLPVPLLQARLMFTFNQALLPLYHVPQAWHEAASVMQALKHNDSARDYWTRSIEVMPSCDVLYMALARFEEGQQKPAEARQALEALVAARPTPLNFVHLMRFAFRAEGVKEARKVFSRARKAEGCTWHVYAASADMEFVLGGGEEGAQVAQNIYKLGANKFPTEVPFLLQYLRFLLAQRDLTNVRAVLERALQAVQGRQALELWNLYLEVENLYGELAAAASVENRRAAAFPELPTGSLYSFAQQQSHLGLWPAEPTVLKQLRDMHALQAAAKADAKGAGAAAAAAAAAAAQQQAQPNAAPKPQPPPNFSLYVEYTGLDTAGGAQPGPPPPAQRAAPPPPMPMAAGQQPMSPAQHAAPPMLSQPLPPTLAAFVAALPPAGTSAGLPAPAEIEELFERLAQLPDTFEQLPPMASPLQHFGSPVHDLYADRQKKQKTKF